MKYDGKRVQEMVERAIKKTEDKYRPLLEAAMAVRDAYMREGATHAGCVANERLVGEVEKLEG